MNLKPESEVFQFQYQSVLQNVQILVVDTEIP